MRREMKYAIGIGILIIAVGIWFFNSAPPATEPSSVDSGITDSTAEPMTEDILESEPVEVVLLEPAPAASEAGETTNAVGSPAPAAGPAGEQRGMRPSAVDLSGVHLNPDIAATTATDEEMVVWEPGLDSAPNSEGEARTADRDRRIPEAESPAAEIPKAEAPVEMRTHVIQPGDNFSKLAAQYLGHAKYARLISEANPDLEPRRLQIGTKIRIPEPPQSAARATNATPPPVSRAGDIREDRRYTIQAGETWYDLGKKFLGDGMRGVELYELNKERVPRDPNLLPAGTIIELPAGVKATQ